MTLARHAAAAGLVVTAVCDRDDALTTRAVDEFDARGYGDLDLLLEHSPMDAVIVANDFDQHAPVAIAALDHGLSVLSETAACRTVSEGVALIEAVERSNGVYMFGANYPYMPFCRRIASLYESGDIGEAQYAEAEYLHTPGDFAWLTSQPGHWRTRLPPTYYCTHTIAPVMRITHSRPTEVSAFLVPWPHASSEHGPPEAAAELIVRLDNGAVLKSLHGFLVGEQTLWLRIHGTRALAENGRGVGAETVRLVTAPTAGAGEEKVTTLLPDADDCPPGVAREGHGSADWRMMRDFAAALSSGENPEQDVQFGVAATITGIQAMRSLTAGSIPAAIPDLASEAVRAEWAGDDWYPDLDAMSAGDSGG